MLYQPNYYNSLLSQNYPNYQSDVFQFSQAPAQPAMPTAPTIPNQPAMPTVPAQPVMPTVPAQPPTQANFPWVIISTVVTALLTIYQQRQAQKEAERLAEKNKPKVLPSTTTTTTKTEDATINRYPYPWAEPYLKWVTQTGANDVQRMRGMLGLL